MLDTTGLPLDAEQAGKELLNTLHRIQRSVGQRIDHYGNFDESGFGSIDLVITTNDLPGFWDDITGLSKDTVGRVTVYFDSGETCDLEDLSPDALIKILEALDGM